MPKALKAKSAGEEYLFAGQAKPNQSYQKIAHKPEQIK